MAKNETKAVPEELEQNKEPEENQEPKTEKKGEEETLPNPEDMYNGKPLPPGNKNLPIGQSSSLYNNPPGYGFEIKSGPYKAPGEPF